MAKVSVFYNSHMGNYNDVLFCSQVILFNADAWGCQWRR